MKFYNWKSPAFLVWLGFCLFGAYTFLPMFELTLADGGVYGAGAIILALLIIFPVAMLLRWFDVLDQEPLGNVIAAIVWGGLAATAAAGPANDALVTLLSGVVTETSGWQAAVIAPATEELLKVLVVVLLVIGVRKDIHGVMDGVIYGAFAGLGFEVVENLMYYFNWLQAGLEQGYGPESGLEVLAARTYFALSGSHIAWTAVLGGAALYAVHYSNESLSRRLWVLGGGLAVSGVLHAFWNSPVLEDLPDALYILKGLPTIVTFIALLQWTSKHEEQLLARALKTLPAGLIRAGEGSALVNPWKRIKIALHSLRLSAEDRRHMNRLRTAQLALVRAAILDYPKSIVGARVKAVRSARQGHRS
jgi:RsiW-degrading membrane proteinase PrsW (M82 family)